MPTLSSPNVLIAGYKCSWAYFFKGVSDWWAERCDPHTSDSQRPGGTARGPVWAVAAVSWAMVVGLGLAMAVLGPAIAGGMGLLGTQLIASAAMALSAISALTLLVGAPVWAGIRANRFSKAMCFRGWELSNGIRKPHRAT